jgi:hypothetical protein
MLHNYSEVIQKGQTLLPDFF